MTRYSKVSKAIALFNSYHSLEGSDYGYNEDVKKAMNYCVDGINKLGYCFDDLPVQMDELIEYLKSNKQQQ